MCLSINQSLIDTTLVLVTWQEADDSQDLRRISESTGVVRLSTLLLADSDSHFSEDRDLAGLPHRPLK